MTGDSYFLTCQHPICCKVSHSHETMFFRTMNRVLGPGRQSSNVVQTACFAKRSKIVKLPRLSPVLASLGDNFFASEGSSSWSELGASSGIEEALTNQGFTRPSRVQELVLPVVVSGQSTVIAAETGSGKTLAYLVPIASLLIRQKERLADDPTGRRYHALVLCPNVALCHQVLSVALSLNSANDSPSFLSAAHINASNPPPAEAPDIIVSTPAALASFILEAGPAYGMLWTPEGLASRVRHVVLDEADLLLGKAFSKQVTRLLDIFRFNDRRRVEAKVISELGIRKDDIDKLPKPMQQACWKDGSFGLKEAGYRVPKGWPAFDPSTFGPYWRRQYLFAAATMPSVMMSDVGNNIQRMFPDIEWVSSELLHQSKPRLQHTWQKVDDATCRKALLDAILTDPDYAAGTARTIVFAGETSSADSISEMLGGEGLCHVVYHKNRPQDERAAALEHMSQQASTSERVGRVMVCTDAAARGLDIQGLTHVIQADFAPNAVDFIHRIGRTGRADRSGKVTSLYREFNAGLVQVLQQYVEEGRPLEAAFSRARSFSRKIKRRGEFIPRGYTKGQYDKEMGRELGGEAAAGAQTSTEMRASR